MNTRKISDVKEGIFLDAAVTYDGRYDLAVLGNSEPASWDVGAEIVLAGWITEPDAIVGQTIIVGASRGNPGVLRITRFVSYSEIHTVVEVPVPEDLRAPLVAGAKGTDTAFGRDSVAGLVHLAGQTVSALADGWAVHDLAVDAYGLVELPADQFPYGASLIHVGLPYNADFQSLDVAQERTKQKVVSKVWLEYEGSRGGWAGTDLDNPDTLQEFRQRKVADAFNAPPLENGIMQVLMRGRWGQGGAAGIRQSDPLPLTILAVTREVELGG
jgi:hypothetical protein